MLLSVNPIYDTTAFPSSAVVQILTTFPNGQIGQGTGTMVNRNTVLTAGYLVYNYSDGGFAKSIEVLAGRNGNSEPFGVAHSTHVQTFDSFIADSKIDAGYPVGDGDIGFISLDRNLGDLTGWLGVQVESGSNYNYNVFKDGYPSGGGYDGAHMYGELGALNGSIAGTSSAFGSWQWSTSSMSSLPGQGGSSLFLYQNGQPYIIGVQDVGNSTQGFAEIITQTVFDSLRSFEGAYPPTGYVAGFLAFSSASPSTVVAGSNFNLAIFANDNDHNPLTGYSGPITLTIPGPNGALGYSTTVNAQNGVASFTNLDLKTPGTYDLLATSNNFWGANLTITVTPPTPPTPLPPVPWNPTPPSPSPSPQPPSPVGALSLFGWGFGPGFQPDIFEVDQAGQVFAAPLIDLFGGQGGISFINSSVVLSDLLLQDPNILGLLFDANNQPSLIEILSFSDPHVYNAALNALLSAYYGSPPQPTGGGGSNGGGSTDNTSPPAQTGPASAIAGTYSGTVSASSWKLPGDPATVPPIKVTLTINANGSGHVTLSPDPDGFSTDFTGQVQQNDDGTITIEGTGPNGAQVELTEAKIVNGNQLNGNFNIVEPDDHSISFDATVQDTGALRFVLTRQS